MLVDNLQVVHGDAVDTTTTSSFRIDANIYCGDVQGLDNRPVQLDRSDVPIEWKTHCSKDHDPFSDASQVFVCQTEVARYIQGELVNHADLVAKYQYRTHIFQLFLCGITARFLRYDHTAAIVSESFNYITNSPLLVEFLHRLSHLTRAELGHDVRYSTALTDDDRNLAMEKLGCFFEGQQKSRPIASLTVGEENRKAQAPCMGSC